MRRLLPTAGLAAVLVLVLTSLSGALQAKESVTFESLDAQQKKTVCSTARAYFDPSLEFLWRPRKEFRTALESVSGDVTAQVETGRSALITAWRAGACPIAAESTLPTMARSICPGSAPARFTASRIATAPRSDAEREAKAPWKLPMGVRTALAMTTSVSLMGVSDSARLKVWPSEARGERGETNPAPLPTPLRQRLGGVILRWVGTSF